MSSVFISYVEEDHDIALAIAEGLQAAGYSTWYYERDSLPGLTFLVQINKAITGCQAFVLILSPQSLRSEEVKKEVESAYNKRKAFLPVMSGVSYGDVSKEEFYSQALGTATAVQVPKEGVNAHLIRRLVGGLQVMGILPGEKAEEAPPEAPREQVPSSLTADQAREIAARSPLPVAAAFARLASGPVEAEGAQAFRTALQHTARSGYWFLGVIAAAVYARESIFPGQEIAVIEEALPGLAQGSLEGAARLLAALPYPAKPEQPVAELLDSFHQVKEADSPLAKACAILRGTSGKVEAGELALLLAGIENTVDPGGLKPLDLLRLLRPAVESALLDWNFLCPYTLAASPDGLHLYAAEGRELFPAAEVEGAQSGHVYWQDKNGSEPLDLSPLLVCRDCPACGRPALFGAFALPGGGFELRGLGCEHTLALEPGDPWLQSLADFFDLERRRETAEINIPAAYLPYATALDEVITDDGQISPAEQQKLEFLARMLNVPPQLAAWMDRRAQKKRSARPQPSPEAEAEPAPPKPLVELVQLEQIEPQPEPEPEEEAPLEAAPADVHFYHPLWQFGQSPVYQAALLGWPLNAFLFEEDGQVTCLNEAQRVQYREHFDERFYRVAAEGEQVFAGSWEGKLYALGRRELLWQAELEGPVSSLVTGRGGAEVAAGAWSGEVVTYRRGDGCPIWRQRMEDGVSALAVSPAAGWTLAGSYSGQLMLVDAQGELRWTRSMYAGVAQIAFVAQGREAIIATRDHQLIRIRLESQETLWEYAVGKPLLNFSLALNERRLAAAARDGQVLLFQLNGGLTLRAEYNLAGLAQAQVLPVFADARLVLAHAGGLSVFDTRAGGVSCEIDGQVDCLAVTPDGHALLAGGRQGAQLFRFTRPELKVGFAVQGKLQKNRFTRIELRLRNQGERPAHDVSVEIEGRVSSKPARFEGAVSPGKSLSSSQHSIQPLDEGALPLRLRLMYQDDLGIDYIQEEDLVVDVAAGD